MKLHALFIGLWLCTTGIVAAQETYTVQYKAVYTVKYSPDSLHRANRSEQKLYLFSGKDKSVSSYYDIIEHQKKMERLRKKYGALTTFSFSYSRGGAFQETFYKDLRAKKIKTVAVISDKKYIFSEPKANVKWQLLDSTKQILNYAVHKATTHYAGRDYVAWFTLKIPVQDGPYVFYGLPGLIVEMYDTRKDYFFSLKSFKKLESPKTWTIPEAEAITKTKFRAYKKKARRNAILKADPSYILGHMEGVNGSITTGSTGNVLDADLKLNGKKVSIRELKRAYKKRLKSENNPIELE